MPKGFSTPRQFRGELNLSAVLQRNWKALTDFMNGYVVRFEEDGKTLALANDLSVTGNIAVAPGSTVDGVDISLWGTGAGTSIYLSSAQSIPNITWTPISFSGATWNDEGLWVVGSPTRLTIAREGWYLLVGQVQFPSNGVGQRIVAIYRNGSEASRVQHVANSAGSQNTTLNISLLYKASVADFFELVVYQDSGGATNVAGGLTFLQAFRLSA